MKRIEKYELLFIKLISSGDIKYNIGNIVNSTITTLYGDI